MGRLPSEEVLPNPKSATMPKAASLDCKRRAGTSPGSCPRCERDSFSRTQRFPESFAFRHAKLGLYERHSPILVIDDEPGCALVAVDPKLPHVTARELDDSDARFHDTILIRRKSFQSSDVVRSGSMLWSRRSIFGPVPLDDPEDFRLDGATMWTADRYSDAGIVRGIDHLGLEVEKIDTKSAATEKGLVEWRASRGCGHLPHMRHRQWRRLVLGNELGWGIGQQLHDDQPVSGCGAGTFDRRTGDNRRLQPFVRAHECWRKMLGQQRLRRTGQQLVDWQPDPGGSARSIDQRRSSNTEKLQNIRAAPLSWPPCP